MIHLLIDYSRCDFKFVELAPILFELLQSNHMHTLQDLTLYNNSSGACEEDVLAMIQLAEVAANKKSLNKILCGSLLFQVAQSQYTGTVSLHLL